MVWSIGILWNYKKPVSEYVLVLAANILILVIFVIIVLVLLLLLLCMIIAGCQLLLQ